MAKVIGTGVYALRPDRLVCGSAQPLAARERRAQGGGLKPEISPIKTPLAVCPLWVGSRR